MASIFTDLDTGSDQDLFTALSTMTSEAELPSALRNVRSLTFDLMGTCVDWHTSIVHALHSIPQPRSSDPVDPSQLAKDWRAGFFQATFDSFQRGEHNPDMDVVHRQVLDRLLGDRGVANDVWNDEVRERLVRAWHHQSAWLDADQGIQRLKQKLDVMVLANGTTRLQLDIIASSGLPFHALFSSQLLGYTKPDPQMYKRCLELLDRRPEEVAMVAAHAYDLRAAKKIGMRTIYIHRDTEDPEEDMDQIRADVDLFLDGTRSTGAKGGLLALADLYALEFG